MRDLARKSIYNLSFFSLHLLQYLIKFFRYVSWDEERGKIDILKLHKITATMAPILIRSPESWLGSNKLEEMAYHIPHALTFLKTLVDEFDLLFQVLTFASMISYLCQTES